MSSGNAVQDGAVGPTTAAPAAVVPPPPAAPRPGPRRSWVIVVVVVVLALVVLAIAFDGLIPGVHVPGGKGGAGAGPSGAVPFSVARVDAVQAASSAHGGPWSVALAAAIDSVTPFKVPALASSNLSGSGCAYTPGPAAGTISVGASTGGIGSGASPFWLFELSNSSAAVLLVLVQNGSAAIYGSLSGSSCESGLASSSTLPSTVIDSSTAIQDANSAGGAAFLSAHPDANASLGIVSESASSFLTLPATWAIIYSDCSVTASASTRGQEFVALIGAVNGTLETADTTTTTCTSLLTALPKIGVAEPTPLSDALSIGASSAARCTGSEPTESCRYNFSVESAASGVVPIGLSLHLLNATGVSSDALVSNVTLLDPVGCVVGTYTISTTGSATWLASPTLCRSDASIYGPLAPGDTLELSTDRSIGGQGYRLVVQDVGVYTGQVEAPVS
jgi:hypothetical protein